jgi:TonB family protein
MKPAHPKLLRLLAVTVVLTAGCTLYSQEASSDTADKTATKDSTARTVMVDGVAEPVYHPGKGVTFPRQVYSPDPEFSDEARRRKIEGVVTLSAIVTSKGETTEIRVLHGRGYGLDEKAVDAVRQWKFDPATKGGKPVSVELAIEVDFRLYHRH